ncbi:putative F-box domain-containing protein [Helianthus annuus]|nr:putative F-box domain-containing protein [Helianthus annuus]KAJ0623963.1 putative F-box domain-containing protein [Helianthus annuus]
MDHGGSGPCACSLQQDPLVVCGSDIMLMILSRLDARSLASTLGVSRRWRSVASSDIIWSKKDAPEYWRNLDPYWTGAEDAPMHRYFHPDGSQTADSSDQVWGGHESCYSIVTSFLADGTIREHYVRINRWPKLRISRREDWGWEMSNRLYCYSSVPDAHMKGGTGPCLPIL